MAATKLYFAKTGVMEEKNYSDLLDKAMDAYVDQSAMVPIEGEQFFTEETASTDVWKMITWQKTLHTPRKNTDTDPLPYDQPIMGYSKEITVSTYRLGIRITRELQETDRSGKTGEMMSGLLDAGRVFHELSFADIFNNGTSTAGADGSFLFASDHYYQDASVGQWSNTETGAAFSSTSVNAMRTSMAKRKNTHGFPMPIELKKLVIPSDLQDAARKYVSSDKVYDSSLNATNPWKGTEMMVWHYLTSTTAWFGWGDLKPSCYGLHYVVLTRPEIAKLAYPSADYPDVVAGWRIRERTAFGASILLNCHRNAGA